jgi:hypothetical protein
MGFQQKCKQCDLGGLQHPSNPTDSPAAPKPFLTTEKPTNINFQPELISQKDHMKVSYEASSAKL